VEANDYDSEGCYYSDDSYHPVVRTAGAVVVGPLETKCERSDLCSSSYVAEEAALELVWKLLLSWLSDT
jgi:hypothetical protein